MEWCYWIPIGIVLIIFLLWATLNDSYEESRKKQIEERSDNGPYQCNDGDPGNYWR